jgi:hypothetical protein
MEQFIDGAEDGTICLRASYANQLQRKAQGEKIRWWRQSARDQEKIRHPREIYAIFE